MVNPVSASSQFLTDPHHIVVSVVNIAASCVVVAGVAAGVAKITRLTNPRACAHAAFLANLLSRIILNGPLSVPLRNLPIPYQQVVYGIRGVSYFCGITDAQRIHPEVHYGRAVVVIGLAQLVMHYIHNSLTE